MGASGGGGTTWRRLQTSLQRLDIQWISKRPSAETTLEVQQAIEHLRGDDPRPLLILRDCEGCPNQEGDLLARTLEDERIQLASPWFHCVRVDERALEDEHPLRNLFTGQHPNHVVVSSWDASRVIFVSRASTTQLWRSMERVLRQDYQKNPASAVSGLVSMLSEFDALDERRQELEQQLERHRERSNDRRIRKVEGELERIGKRFEQLFETEAELRDLGLRHVPERDGEVASAG